MWDALKDLLHETLFFIHDQTSLSWALSIVAFTCLVRLAIFPITAKQTRSMLAMQKLSPYVKQLQQKYKDDRQELNIKMLEFYRDNKVNPLASCLPILVQIPIFIALFQVLNGFGDEAGVSKEELSFLFGRIDDITKDPVDVGFWGWALVVFYATSQLFAGKVMATSPDPRQRMLMMLLPILFVPFIINFPIGLLIYWITTNLWTIGQYLLVVAVTDTNREVVLPEDSKGRKKVVAPKGQRAAAGKSGQPKAAAVSQRNDKPVRKNKRRR